MTITGITRVYALLGDPVAHSLSPRMHNAGFLAAGVDATYVAIRCNASDVVSMMRMLSAAGGGGNVTVPHKTVAAECAVPGSIEAALGAVNAFAQFGDEMVVANTDVDGIAGSVEALAPAASTWLVVGTGGSARAAVGAAVRSGARVAVASRDKGRADTFSAWATSIGALVVAADEADFAINATPLGLHAGDVLPIDPAALRGVRAALDLTYRPAGTTAWCERWRDRGVPALDGRETLLRQGVASWRHWLPGVEPPIEVMRAVLNGEMD